MYVYFIEAMGVQTLKRIKIGRSKDPKTRLQDLQVGSPVKLYLLGSIKCRSEDHALRVENLAHSIFHKQRCRGEWFHLSRKHYKQIKNLIEKAATTI